MTAGSDVRLNTERIDAVAKALADFYGCAFNPDEADHWRTIADHVLDADDAADSWNETERLRTALRTLEATIQFAEDASDDGWRIRLISLHDARVEARRALAESVPSPSPKREATDG